MKHLLIYAHFHPSNTMASYALHSLRAFRAMGYEVLVASTSPIADKKTQVKLAEMGCRLMLVENIGYDFYAWRSAILALTEELQEAHRLVLLNSSVQGPFFDLSKFLAELEARPADVLGATLSQERCPHLQSYFYYFKSQVFRSEYFLDFWRNLTPFASRQETIDQHELRFTQHLVDGGFVIDAFHVEQRLLNPSLKLPQLLYQKQLPFLKVRKFRNFRHLLLRARLSWRRLTLEQATPHKA